MPADFFATKTIHWTAPPLSPTHPATPHLCVVLLQNENGPCALLAVANTLIMGALAGQFDGALGECAAALLLEVSRGAREQGRVAVGLLVETLGGLLVQGGDPAYVDAALALLPGMLEGLNIDPVFDGTVREGPELAVFRAFGVPLVHAWVSENPELALLLYEQAQTKMVEGEEAAGAGAAGVLATTIRKFIRDSPGQITAAGLARLVETLVLPEGAFGVFFRGEHFSTVYRYFHPGTGRLGVYNLVTDEGFRRQPHHVWQEVSVGGDDGWYDGGFEDADLAEAAEALARAAVEEEIPDNENDLAYARQLQEKEDARMARELAAASKPSPNTPGGRRAKRDKNSASRTTPKSRPGGRTAPKPARPALPDSPSLPLCVVA